MLYPRKRRVRLGEEGAMSPQTTPAQRQDFYHRHLAGATYHQIAVAAGVAWACVRYWCRRLRQGGPAESAYPQRPGGLMSRFDPKIRFRILYLRLKHPRWGPTPIRHGLGAFPALRDLPLPSPAVIGRYLHQWPRFRRPPAATVVRQRPRPPTAVQQRWQIDFKLGIPLSDGRLVNLHTVRDPVGAACLAARLTETHLVARKPARVTLPELQATLRGCFAAWHTRPDEVQTDGEGLFIGQPQDRFPSSFTLWLRGLGIAHLVIRPGVPTDNAEVERCHQTLMNYAIIGQEDLPLAELQVRVDAAVHILNHELPSHAHGCGGQPPVVAHPELLQPRRPYAGAEGQVFDLARVDQYLATLQWTRRVSKAGQVSLGGPHIRYSVGHLYARQQVLIRFDPADRHFVFFTTADLPQDVGRQPVKNLSVADLTGLVDAPAQPSQLSLPLDLEEWGKLITSKKG
jgi:transposase InsO family protein